MFEMLRREAKGAVQPVAASRKAVANVTVVPAMNVRQRAVITRYVRQVAVVEFDATEGQDYYKLGMELAKQVPDDQWASEGPTDAYVDRIENV